MSRKWGAKGLARGCLVTADGTTQAWMPAWALAAKVTEVLWSQPSQWGGRQTLYHPAAISGLWIKNQMGKGEEVGGEEPSAGPSVPATSQNLPPGPWGPQIPALPFPPQPVAPRNYGLGKTHSLGS